MGFWENIGNEMEEKGIPSNQAITYAFTKQIGRLPTKTELSRYIELIIENVDTAEAFKEKQLKLLRLIHRNNKRRGKA